MDLIVSLENRGLKFKDISDYEMQDYIGSSNSLVFCYENKKTNDVLVVKQTQVEDEQEQDVFSQLQLQQKIMNAGLHPHIVTVFGFCKIIKQKVIGSQEYYLTVMELCECNLDELVNHRKLNSDKFSLKEIKDFLQGTVSALEYLQRQLLIAHRDIKPENILYSKDQKFKLADFDNSQWKQNKTVEKQLPRITPCFAAPELLKAHIQMKQMITYNSYKADVYSLGLCLLYMCTFRRFTQRERCHQTLEDKLNYQNEVHALIKQVKIYYEKTLSKILKMMLNEDAFQRVDFIQLKKRLQEKGYWNEVGQHEISPSLQEENTIQSQTYKTPNDKLQLRDETISDINFEDNSKNQKEEESYRETLMESHTQTIAGSEIDKLGQRILKQKIANAQNINYDSGYSIDSGKISPSMRNTNINLDEESYLRPGAGKAGSLMQQQNSHRPSIANSQRQGPADRSPANADAFAPVLPAPNLMEFSSQRKVVLVLLWIFMLVTLIMSVLYFFGIFPY